MSSFDDREKSQENRFAHSQKLSFEVEARTCKLFGLWAAKKLGLGGTEADAYAGSVVESNLAEAGLQDVVRKVRADFDEKGVEVSDHMMDIELEKATNEARKQILGSED